MPVLREQKAAADALGVTPRTLRDWRAEPGFPDCSAGYDLDAIRRWRDEQTRKGSDEATQAKRLKLATQAQKLRLEKARADAAERAEQAAQGNILPRDECETAIAEMITLARDRLTALPKTLCRIVPRQYHRRLQDEGGKEIARILNEFSASLERTAAGVE